MPSNRLSKYSKGLDSESKEQASSDKSSNDDMDTVNDKAREEAKYGRQTNKAEILLSITKRSKTLNNNATDANKRSKQGNTNRDRDDSLTDDPPRHEPQGNPCHPTGTEGRGVAPTRR